MFYAADASASPAESPGRLSGQASIPVFSKELDPEAVEQLFTEGKTPLLDGFISKRTKRPFKAHLTLDFENGKIGFEFAPRPVKKAAKKKAKKS